MLLVASAIAYSSGAGGVRLLSKPGAPRPQVAIPAAGLRTPRPLQNPILVENARPGSGEWGIDENSGSLLEGYANRTSVDPGGVLTLYISTSESSYSIQVFRMGWYKGLGARLMWERSSLPGVRQPGPYTDPKTKMVEARWEPSLQLPIGQDWPTGVYLAALRMKDRRGSYIPFVVREQSRRAPIVFQSSVTTWQAYNRWGGRSLYEGLTGKGQSSAAGRSTVVSFDRPYREGSGAGDFIGLELPLLSWVEAEGYDVAYITNIDTHEDPGVLNGRRAFLSLGHDEYWSTDMREHIERGIGDGVNLAFFGANAIYRHIRLEGSSLGPNRRQVNYRSAKADPVSELNPAESTVEWRSPPVNRPEDSVLGAMYECNPVKGDLVVYDTLGWLFKGTGLAKSDRVLGILGSEYDRVFAGHEHASRMWVLFRSPLECRGYSSVADTTIYRAASGALVFNAATSRFLCIFTGCRGAPRDERMQKLVQNMLDTFIGVRAPTPETSPMPFSADGQIMGTTRNRVPAKVRRPQRSTEPLNEPAARPSRTARPTPRPTPGSLTPRTPKPYVPPTARPRTPRPPL